MSDSLGKQQKVWWWMFNIFKGKINLLYSTSLPHWKLNHETHVHAQDLLKQNCYKQYGLKYRIQNQQNTCN